MHVRSRFVTSVAFFCSAVFWSAAWITIDIDHVRTGRDLLCPGHDLGSYASYGPFRGAQGPWHVWQHVFHLRMFDGSIPPGGPGGCRQSPPLSRRWVVSGDLERKSPGSFPRSGVYHLLSRACEVRARMVRCPAGRTCGSLLLRQRCFELTARFYHAICSCGSIIGWKSPRTCCWMQRSACEDSVLN